MKKYVRLMLGAKSAHIDECLKGNFIGADFDFIAKSYKFNADTEELIAPREW